MTQVTSGNIFFHRFIHISHLKEGEHLNLEVRKYYFEPGEKYINMAAIVNRFYDYNSFKFIHCLSFSQILKKDKKWAA